MSSFRLLSRRSGFSQSEILIALGLIAVVSVLVLPRLLLLTQNPEQIAKEQKGIEDTITASFENYQAQNGLVSRSVSPSAIFTHNFNSDNQNIINSASELPSACAATTLPATQFKLKDAQWSVFIPNQWTHGVGRGQDSSNICIASASNPQAAKMRTIYRHGASIVANNNAGVSFSGVDTNRTTSDTTQNPLSSLQDGNGPLIVAEQPTLGGGTMFSWSGCRSGRGRTRGPSQICIGTKTSDGTVIQKRISMAEFKAAIRVDWQDLSPEVLSKIGWTAGLKNLSFDDAYRLARKLVSAGYGKGSTMYSSQCSSNSPTRGKRSKVYDPFACVIPIEGVQNIDGDYMKRSIRFSYDFEGKGSPTTYTSNIGQFELLGIKGEF